MRIALYYPWLYLKSGIERTIIEIIKRSTHEYALFTNHYKPQSTYPDLQHNSIIELTWIPVKRNLPAVAYASLVVALQKLPLLKFDLLMVNCDGLGDLITLRNNKIPILCFCHTPLRPVFDVEYRRRVLLRYKSSRPLFFLLSSGFKSIDRALWKRYAYILFNSRETLKRAKDGHLLNGRNSDSYSILHPGIDTKSLKPTWIYSKYFLLPGRIMWTKNIELAINSFKHFFKNNPASYDFKLIIAGTVDKKSEIYLRALRKITAGNPKIDFVISPSAEQMWDLYRNAYAVIATAFNEDWGMTPLEAMAFGKPVIAVNRGGFPESVKHMENGMLVNPDIDSVSKAMTLLVNNFELTKRLGGNGFKLSSAYDWSIFVAELDARIEKIVFENKKK